MNEFFECGKTGFEEKFLGVRSCKPMKRCAMKMKKQTKARKMTKCIKMFLMKGSSCILKSHEVDFNELQANDSYNGTIGLVYK